MAVRPAREVPLKSKRLIIILPMLIAVALCWSGCGNREPLAPASPSLGGESPAMIEFGTATNDQTRWPGQHNLMKINAFAISHDHATTRPIGLDQNYEMRFLPLVAGEINASSRIETSVLVGEAETVVGVSTPISLSAPELKDRARIDALKQMTRIDLTRFRGKNIRLRWRAIDLPADTTVMIGLPQLVPLQPRERKPDILLACSDTHRVDFAFGGPGRERMPHLRELTEKATVFSRTYATASWTLPSITSIFTGKFPRGHRTGERTASGDSASQPDPEMVPAGEFIVDVAGSYYQLTSYPGSLTSLGEKLSEAGYTCVWVAANAFYESSGLGDDLGGVALYTGAIAGDRVNQDAMALLEAAPPDQPLAMLVHWMDVHEWQSDQRYPADAQLGAAGAIARDRYGDAVADSDRFLNEFLQAWTAARGFDETLFMFFSDHGEHVHDLDEWDLPVTGHGMTMLESLLHVPLLVHFPQSLRLDLRGRTITRPVSLVDLHPTILEIAGADAGGEKIDGRSLIARATQSDGEDRTFFADYQLYGPERSSVRRGDFKLMFDFSTGEEVLVNTTLSTGTLREVPDMKITDPRIQESLKLEFERYRSEATRDAAGLKSDRKMNPEALKRLKGLGYIQ